MKTATKNGKKNPVHSEYGEAILFVDVVRLNFLAEGFPIFEMRAELRWLDSEGVVRCDSHNPYSGIKHRAFIRGANEYPVRASAAECHWHGDLTGSNVEAVSKIIKQAVKKAHAMEDDEGYATTLGQDLVRMARVFGVPIVVCRTGWNHCGADIKDGEHMKIDNRFAASTIDRFVVEILRKHGKDGAIRTTVQD